MSQDLTPRQQILLWDLISRGGSALQKDLKPKVEPKDREPLVKAKMISYDPKERPFRLAIEEPGWNHVASVRPTLLAAGEGSKYDRPILQFVLAMIQAYAAKTKPPLTYANLFSRRPDENDGDAPKTVVSPPLLPLQTVIRSAFFDIAGRPPRDGVRLRALREKLANVERAALDAALLEMRKSGAANLMNLDNPRDIEAEGDAPLKVGGQTFHLLWIEP